MTSFDELCAPWRLEFDRDGTEDFGTILDADGTPLATNAQFWLPENDDPTPHALRAIRLMTAAPELLDALNLLLEQTVDMDLKYGIILSEGERLARAKALRAIRKAHSSAIQHRQCRSVPPDPEAMNDQRSAWAAAAIHTFRRVTGTDLEDALGDLLADLMHWADRNQFDFDAALDRGRYRYSEETKAGGGV